MVKVSNGRKKGRGNAESSSSDKGPQETRVELNVLRVATYVTLKRVLLVQQL